MSRCKSYTMGCPGVPNCAISLIAITVAPHKNTESFWQWAPDRDQPTTDSDLEFPEEGVYLFYLDRAVQIAASPCAIRKCERTKICSCDHHDDEFSQPIFINNLFKQHNEEPKPCVECLYSWLNLNIIQEFVDRFAMTLIAQPKSLHLTHIIGKPLMEYDFADDTYLSRTFKTVQSSQMALIIDTWNSCLSSIVYHSPRVSPLLSQSPSSLHNNIASDDEIDIMDIDDGFLIIKNEASDADKDDFDCFNDIIEEEFSHSRAFRHDLSQLKHDETDKQFIFGLDDLGKLDGPDMTELPEDDHDMIPVVNSGLMNFTRSHSNIIPDSTRSPEHNSPVVQTRKISVAIAAYSTTHIKGKNSDPQDFSNLDDSDDSEDSDEYMTENEALRYHYCTRKPCPLNCQDPDSRNPWRCMDDHPNYRRQEQN